MSEPSGIQVPAEPSFDNAAFQGSLQQLLQDNIGAFVTMEFLIGTSSMVNRQGLLYAVGTSYVVLYDDVKDVYKRQATDRGAHDYDGVFIFRPAVTLEQLLPGLKQEKGFIVVDRRMATNLPLVYAAGDCTGQPLQIAKAVGEGNVAAISAAEDLQRSASGRG